MEPQKPSPALTLADLKDFEKRMLGGMQRFKTELKEDIIEELVPRIDKMLDAKLSGAIARLVKWEIPQKMLPELLQVFLPALLDERLALMGQVDLALAVPYNGIPELKDANT